MQVGARVVCHVEEEGGVVRAFEDDVGGGGWWGVLGLRGLVLRGVWVPWECHGDVLSCGSVVR